MDHQAHEWQDSEYCCNGGDKPQRKANHETSMEVIGETNYKPAEA